MNDEIKLTFFFLLQTIGEREKGGKWRKRGKSCVREESEGKERAENKRAMRHFVTHPLVKYH